jgi:hypothetical protein
MLDDIQPDAENYDERSAREADAARAFKSALIGILFCPLLFYAAYLLLEVFLSDEPLRPRYRRYAVATAAILAIIVAINGALLLTLFMRDE